MQDLPADGQTLYERRFNSPLLMGRLFHLKRESDSTQHHQKTKVKCISSAQKFYLDICWILFEPGEKLESEDLQTSPQPDIHMQRFESKEVNNLKRNNEFVFPCRTAKSSQKDSRYLPLCTKRRTTSCKNLSNILQKKKKKPEIQIEMSKLDKISEALLGTSESC